LTKKTVGSGGQGVKGLCRKINKRKNPARGQFKKRVKNRKGRGKKRCRRRGGGSKSSSRGKTNFMNRSFNVAKKRK